MPATSVETNNFLSQAARGAVLVGALAGFSFGQQPKSKSDSLDNSPAPPLVGPSEIVHVSPSCFAAHRLTNARNNQPSLQSAIAGVELLVDSPSRAQLLEVASYWQRGIPAPAQKVETLLSIARTEHGTYIQSERMGKILAQHSEPAVILEALRYLYEADLAFASENTLRAPLKHSDSQIVAMALLLRSKDVGRRCEDGFIERYLKSPDRDVRSAAVIASISATRGVPELPAADYFVASRQLTTPHYEAGFELRLAQAMVKEGSSVVTDPQLKALLPEIAMPVLHLLQRIEGAFPGSIRQIIESDKNAFPLVWAACAERIFAERTSSETIQIADVNTIGVVALHFDRSFSPAGSEEIVAALRASSPKIIKAGQTKNNDAGSDTGESYVFKNSPERESYLKRLDAYRTPNPKEDYLTEIKRVTADKERKVLVWHQMHGGPDHSWFYHGTPGSQIVSEYKHHPHAVSYTEIAKVLFETQLERCKPGKSLEFGHVTIFLEACQQYTVAEGALRELESLAKRAKLEIVSYPIFIPLTQPLMYGHMKFLMITASPSPGAPSTSTEPIGEILVNPMFSSLRTAARERGTLTLKDIMSADGAVARQFTADLRAPYRIGQPTHQDSVGNSTFDAKGLLPVIGQDPALFGPTPFDLGEFVRSLHEMLESKGIKVVLPKAQEGAQLRTFLEISSWKTGVDIDLRVS